ncbi:MAG: single-stranded DNA-binding protein [Eubacteriales bacterium]
MNKVTLIGRLTRDPELKYTPQGTAVANFTIAVNRRFKSKSGESEADFIPVVVWGNTGENTAKYMHKGSQIAIFGRMQVRNYQANDGSKRYVTEVIAEEVTFLGSSNNKENNTRRDDKIQDYGVPLDDFHPMEDDDDDLPF